MNDWEKFLERRKKNLGFVTRLGAFHNPTEAEKAAALEIEINSWQATKGTRPFTVSAEYSNPLGHGINLKATRDVGEKAEHREEAIKAYINTDMDIGRDLWIDTDWWTGLKLWFKGKKIKFYKAFKQEKK